MVGLDEFLAKNGDVGRSVDAEADLVALDVDDGDEDVVGNAEGFADAAGENKHWALLALEFPV